MGKRRRGKKASAKRGSHGRALPLLLTVTALLFVLSSFPALGGNYQTTSSEDTSAPTPEGSVEGDGEHYLGLLPTPPGDYPQIAMPEEELRFALPTSVDLSSQLPPVGDQGEQGSCVGWATSYYYKSWVEKQEHTSWDLTNPYYQFSPSFVYNLINEGVDRGAFFTNAFYVLEKTGVVDIAEMPYSDDDHQTLPTASQFEAARPYRIPNDWGFFWLHHGTGPYTASNNIENIKAWLRSGRVLVMGIPIYYDFPDYGGNPAQAYYDYSGSSGLSGWHAVCICGYDDNINPSGSDPDHRGGFKMVNSWGQEWNGPSAGYLYLSYDFVRRYVREAWAMADLAPDSPHISSFSTAGGNAGDTIHIYGNNFGTLRRNARVTFNGVDAADANFTDGDITVTVPSSLVTGPVTVYDWEGTSSNQVNFVLGLASPRIESVSPSSGVQNAIVNITDLAGSNFQPGATVRLDKDGFVINATNVSVSSTKISCRFNLTGAAFGAYDVVVRNPDGYEGRLADAFGVRSASQDIVLCNTDALGVSPEDGLGTDPCMSADGRYVAFQDTSYRELVPGICCMIYRKDLLTGQIAGCDTTGGPDFGASSGSPCISADGRYVAFDSSSHIFVPGDSYLTHDVFRKDMQTGEIMCCSQSASGEFGNDSSLFPSISADGRYVLFYSLASNLVPGDDNGMYDVFRKDLQTGEIVRCSTSASGAQGNGNSYANDISADGRYACISSGATNLIDNDANGATSDIFRKDLQTGEVVLCSVTATGGQPNANCFSGNISSDGRYVSFASYAFNLGGSDINGLLSDIFRKDLQTGELVCCSTNEAGEYGNDWSKNEFSMSSDGRYVAFASQATNLVPWDLNFGDQDIYRKDMSTGEIIIISRNSFGEQANDNCYDKTAISADGRYIAFYSRATNLVPEDQEVKYDVYRRDCSTLNKIEITGIDPATGHAGTEVTISGSGFGASQGSSKVQFGMVGAASYSLWSNNQIRCAVPADVIGEVQVRVVTELGTSNNVPFNVVSATAPTISYITPNYGDVGTTVNIADLGGTNFQTGASVRLEKGSTVIDAIDVSVVTPNKITCKFNIANDAATGSYDVVVINPNGEEGRLTGGFTINAACGVGSAISMLAFALAMGLLSLAGSGSLRRKLRKERT